MFGNNTIKNFKDNNIFVGKDDIIGEKLHHLCYSDHVLVTDKAASGVAPISVDKNGIPTHTQ